MPTSAYQTVGDICAAVFRDTKESSVTLGIVDQFVRWCDEAQQQVMMRKKRPWIDEIFRFQTQAYFKPSATISVTQNSTTVVLGSGTPPSASLDLSFKVNGWDEVYNVAGIAGLNVTLDQPYLGATNSAATGFIFQRSILLNAEIESVSQVTHAFLREPLQQLGPLDFFSLQANDPSRLDYATHWTLYDDTDLGQKRILLYPAPLSAYTVNVHAQKYIPELTTLTQEPVIPIQYRQVIYHYVAMKLYDFHRNDTQKAFYAQNFANWLARIDNDFKPAEDYPQLRVNYARPIRRTLYGKPFDSRYRLED